MFFYTILRIAIKNKTSMYPELNVKKNDAWSDVTEVDRAVRTLKSKPSPKVDSIYDRLARKMGLIK